MVKNKITQRHIRTKRNKTQTNTDSPTKVFEKNLDGQEIGPRESAYIEWQAPEFEYYKKDVSWYWLSLMVSIVLLALSFWQKNFLFAVFIIIAWLVIVYSASRLPEVWNFKIDDKGIEISLANTKEGQKFYSYAEIEGFDIHLASDQYKELVLKFKSRLSPYLKINILANEEEKIKNFLLNHIPKEEYRISLSDLISKLIRF